MDTSKHLDSIKWTADTLLNYYEVFDDKQFKFFRQPIFKRLRRKLHGYKTRPAQKKTPSDAKAKAKWLKNWAEAKQAENKEQFGSSRSNRRRPNPTNHQLHAKLKTLENGEKGESAVKEEIERLFQTDYERVQRCRKTAVNQLRQYLDLKLSDHQNAKPKPAVCEEFKMPNEPAPKLPKPTFAPTKQKSTSVAMAPPLSHVPSNTCTSSFAGDSGFNAAALKIAERNIRFWHKTKESLVQSNSFTSKNRNDKNMVMNVPNSSTISQELRSSANSTFLNLDKMTKSTLQVWQRTLHTCLLKTSHCDNFMDEWNETASILRQSDTSGYQTNSITTSTMKNNNKRQRPPLTDRANLPIQKEPTLRADLNEPSTSSAKKTKSGKNAVSSAKWQKRIDQDDFQQSDDVAQSSARLKSVKTRSRDPVVVTSTPIVVANSSGSKRWGKIPESSNSEEQSICSSSSSSQAEHLELQYDENVRKALDMMDRFGWTFNFKNFNR